MECNRKLHPYIRIILSNSPFSYKLCKVWLSVLGNLSTVRINELLCAFVVAKALPSGEDDEDDSDSDSDDDDVKVTIGNIKTGAPSYMYVLLIMVLIFDLRWL